ncbi:protein kinase domain-containing protein [Blastopirellula marina]|uniref:Tyrosine protein kinase:Serine/threonine protein kinase:PASTA n=1 Tax=Blastopirellula marina DSM 3645 TaxID=314230 RepID=A3ZMU5_9BACT|nr:serine/threonine protein kinase [Blastopirellula marina]EAQ82271.1 Tyrosine protein kinase:Serine/threonine protein kinase:PASTA [Blastopirellula marina DSM 3645]
MVDDSKRIEIRARVNLLLDLHAANKTTIETQLQAIYFDQELEYAQKYLKIRLESVERSQSDGSDAEVAESDRPETRENSGDQQPDLADDAGDAWTVVDRENAIHNVQPLHLRRGQNRFFKGTSKDAKITMFVKYLRKTDSITQAQQVAEVLNEYRRFNVFRDPNVVMVYDAGIVRNKLDEEFPFVAMEYIEGVNLLEWMEERISQRLRPSQREAAEVVQVVAATLQRMLDAPKQWIKSGYGDSAKGELMHLDLKPDNIMIVRQADDSVREASQRTLKLVDFGSAGVAESATGIGAEGYQAPERMINKANREAPNPHWDIYSLGGILYYLVTGKTPVSPYDQSWWNKWSQEIELGDDDLTLICKKCLAYDPAKRYVSPGQLAEDLHAWITDLPLPHVRKNDYTWWGKETLLFKRCAARDTMSDQFRLLSQTSWVLACLTGIGALGYLFLIAFHNTPGSAFEIVGNWVTLLFFPVVALFAYFSRFRESARPILLPVIAYVLAITLIAKVFAPRDSTGVITAEAIPQITAYFVLFNGVVNVFYANLAKFPWWAKCVPWGLILLSALFHVYSENSMLRQVSPAFHWGGQAVTCIMFAIFASQLAAEGENR